MLDLNMFICIGIPVYYQKDDESSYVLRRDEENIEANKGAAEESAKLDDVVEEKESAAETKPETMNGLWPHALFFFLASTVRLFASTYTLRD